MRASRSAPRLWDTDWLVLRPLARLLREQAAAYVAPGALMVDFGCGDMPYAPAMRALGFDYRGADIDDGGDLRIDAAGRVPLPDGCAGAVLSVQVLEHVGDLASYCAEIRRLLRDDGTVLLSTHGNWLYHPHPEDHRRWTRTGLALDLASNGLVVEECLGIAGPLATTTLIRLTGFAFILRKLPLLGAPLAGILAAVMNIRAWLEDKITPAQMRLDNASVYLVRARKVAA
jgi:SAM-dependent methyltransferase